MTCERVRDDLAVVALGDEMPLLPHLLEHLAECKACRQAYRDYLSAGEALIASVPEVGPPPGLKARILAEVASSRAAPERGELEEEPSSTEGPDPAKPVVSDPEERANRKKGARSWGRAPRRAWVWGGAALLALSAGLGLRAARLERELLRLREVERVTLSEVAETLRAFSGAPAVFAGEWEFAEVRAGFAPEGMLYKRPNGWAVVLQVRGVAGEEAHRYRVWVKEGEAWSDAGRLVAAEEDAAALVYYHRGEALPESLWILQSELRPGAPGWEEGALAVGRLLGGAGAGEGDELRLAPGSESGSGW